MVAMGQELVLQSSTGGGAILPAMRIEEAVERRKVMVQFVQQLMTVNTDYGIIPGTKEQTLLKPGAEKLCTLFGLRPLFVVVDKVEDWTGAEHGGEPLFYYAYKCRLMKDGEVIADGDGSCNSWEKKYRYRDAKPMCPACGKTTIFKSKNQNGGFYCFTKVGGCGENFAPTDERITAQATGQIPNPEVADIVNTLQKMSQKRALLAAVLIGVNASEFFTQDMEDSTDHAQEENAAPARQSAGKASTRQQTSGRPPAQRQSAPAHSDAPPVEEPPAEEGAQEETVSEDIKVATKRLQTRYADEIKARNANRKATGKELIVLTPEILELILHAPAADLEKRFLPDGKPFQLRRTSYEQILRLWHVLIDGNALPANVDVPAIMADAAKRLLCGDKVTKVRSEEEPASA